MRSDEIISAVRDAGGGHLDLSLRRLTRVRAPIRRLPGLTGLDLSGNQLPDSIGNLTGLAYLDVRGNRLSALPATFAHLTELVSLNLPGNESPAIPPGLPPRCETHS